MMANISYCLLLLASLLVMAAAQYYAQYNPYNTPSPTFSSLTGYYYTTPSQYYYPTGNQYGTNINNNDMQIRIWPYVIGQYMYPTYYNNDYNNPYASLGSSNWQSYYANAYQNNYGKK